MKKFLERFFDFTKDGIYRFNFNSSEILLANKGFIDILGLDCEPSEIIGKHLKDIMVYTQVEGILRNLIREKGEIHNFEYNFKTLKNKEKWVIHDSFLIKDNETGQDIIECIIKDITERKNLEEKLRRSNRIYKVLSNINQAIIRERDIDRLLKLSCEIAVKDGEIPRACIGVIDPLTDTVKKVACKSSQKINNQQEICCLPPYEFCEKHLFTGDHYIINNFDDYSDDTSWNLDITKGGYKSLAFFPLFVYNHTVGLLGFYSDEINFFDKEEISLLSELSMDISFAMESAEHEKYKKQAEELLENERSFNSTVNEIIGALLVVLDTDGRIVKFNKACEELTGYSFIEVKDKYLWDFLITPDEIEPVKTVFNNLKNAIIPSKFENYLVTKNGEKKLIAWSNTSMIDKNGIVDFIIGTGIDITEQRDSEAKIVKLNEDLNQTVAELLFLNKDLEAFTYNVSHDLKAPLRVIDGYSGILIRDFSPQIDNEGKELLQTIRNKANTMEQIINGFLTFSLLGRDELIFSEIDFSYLVKAIVEEFAKETKKRKIEFIIKNLPPSKADFTMIKQVIFNLLSNAIKFTSKTEKAVIEIGARIMEDKNIYYIKDNGVGFNIKYKDKLFKMHKRLHSQAEYEGTGIGLAICERIISRHKGEVWAEGRVGAGATFYFSLPKIID